MICKKCGANIADTSKFCGNCGEQVNISNESLQSNDIIDVQKATKELDLGNTIRIEPVQEENKIISNSEKIIDSSLNIVRNDMQNAETQVTGNEMQMSIEEQSNSNDQKVVEPISQNNTDINSTKVISNDINKKKSNKILFIFLLIALFIIAFALVMIAITNSSSNSINILEKTLTNLVQKGEKSATIDAKLSITTTTGESHSFSGKIKSEKKSDELINLQVTANKSMMFDEMNMYAEVNKKDVKLYAMSSLIDMLGITSSQTPTWIYYTLSIDEMIDEETANETIQDVELKDIIDEKHFVYIDSANGLNHYELIIDQELLDKIELKENNESEDNSTIESLDEPIKVEFYINNSNELVRIELDVTESLDEEVSSFVIIMEFSDLGSTVVDIPSDAKNSIIDLETYIANNVVGFEGEIENNEINSNTDALVDSGLVVY